MDSRASCYAASIRQERPREIIMTACSMCGYKNETKSMYSNEETQKIPGKAYFVTRFYCDPEFGSALYTDITNLKEDSEKVFKCIANFYFYQQTSDIGGDDFGSASGGIYTLCYRTIIKTNLII
jgi:hypothetical protein